MSAMKTAKICLMLLASVAISGGCQRAYADMPPDIDEQNSVEILSSLDMKEKIIGKELAIAKSEQQLRQINYLSSLPMRMSAAPGSPGGTPLPPPSEAKPHSPKPKESFHLVAVWGVDQNLRADILGSESGDHIVEKGGSIGHSTVSRITENTVTLVGSDKKKHVLMLADGGMGPGTNSSQQPAPPAPLGSGKNSLRSGMYNNMFGGSRFSQVPQAQMMVPPMSPMMQSPMMSPGMMPMPSQVQSPPPGYPR